MANNIQINTEVINNLCNRHGFSKDKALEIVTDLVRKELNQGTQTPLAPTQPPLEDA